MSVKDFTIKHGLNVRDGLLIVNQDGVTINGDLSVTGTFEQLDAETASRIDGDASLQAQLDAETASRIVGDASLQAQLDLYDPELQLLTSGEIQQLQNINTSTVSTIAWSFLGTVNQGLNTSSSPSFSGLNNVSRNPNDSLKSVHIGEDTGNPAILADNTTFVGYGIAPLATNPFMSTIIGSEAGATITGNNTGERNVMVGYRAGYSALDPTENVYIGSEAGRDHLGRHCVFIGYQACYAGNEESLYNTMIGYKVGQWSEGDSNTAIGTYSMRGSSGLTTGTFNTAVGSSTMYYLTTGVYNTAVGHHAGNDYTATNYCTAVGALAGQNAQGHYNTAIGYQSGAANGASLAEHNTSVGYRSMPNFTTGSRNTAVGANALSSVNTQSDMTAVGYYAGLSRGEGNTSVGAFTLYDAGNHNINASYNTVVGAYAASDTYNFSDGHHRNCIFGYQAGRGISTGADDNVIIGYQTASTFNHEGPNNVVIGSQAGIAMSNWTSCIAIGHLALGTINVQQTGIFIGDNCVGSENKNDVVCVGSNTQALNHNVISIGARAVASGLDGSISIGADSSSTTSGAIAIGQDSVSSSGASIAIGDGAQATHTDSISIGNLSSTSNTHSVTIGASSVVGLQAVSVGYAASGSGTQSTAIGYGATASGTGSIRIGSGGTANNTNSTAIGTNASATNLNAVAIGLNATTSADHTCYIGGTNTMDLVVTGTLDVATTATCQTLSVSTITARTATSANILIQPDTFGKVDIGRGSGTTTVNIGQLSASPVTTINIGGGSNAGNNITIGNAAMTNPVSVATDVNVNGGLVIDHGTLAGDAVKITNDSLNNTLALENVDNKVFVDHYASQAGGAFEVSRTTYRTDNSVAATIGFAHLQVKAPVRTSGSESGTFVFGVKDGSGGALVDALTIAGASSTITSTFVGTVDADSYSVGSVAGASFSGAVTNITVVNGIVTAVS